MDFDIIVIGSGPGGYVAAIYAAQLGFKVACVEKYPALGGTCLNVGCIPSKSLLQSSEFYTQMKHHALEHGITTQHLEFNLDQMMKRKEEIVKSFNQGIAGLFKKNKVERILGTASFISPQRVEVTHSGKKSEYSAKYFIIATGSKPIELKALPFDETTILSSTSALSLKKIPKRLIVVGAGVIGVELGSVYNRLGSKVEFIEFLDTICPTLDRAVSKNLQMLLEKQGLQFHLKRKVMGGKISTEPVQLETEDFSGSKKSFEADSILVCIGRSPYIEGLNVASIGLEISSKGMLVVDHNFRTRHPHIFAIGDVIDGPMLAHKAEEEGMAVCDIIKGLSPKIEYLAIPSVVYTDPEVAAVGLTESQAIERNLSIITSQFPFKANSRAGCMGVRDGFVKMIAMKNTKQLLGVHIIGPHAGELIAEAALAIRKRLTATDIAHTSHAHPTLTEALKEAALMIHRGQAIHI